MKLEDWLDTIVFGVIGPLFWFYTLVILLPRSI
jgi:hypothetical protein